MKETHLHHYTRFRSLLGILADQTIKASRLGIPKEEMGEHQKCHSTDELAGKAGTPCIATTRYAHYIEQSEGRIISGVWPDCRITLQRETLAHRWKIDLILEHNVKAIAQLRQLRAYLKAIEELERKIGYVNWEEEAKLQTQYQINTWYNGIPSAFLKTLLSGIAYAQNNREMEERIRTPEIPLSHPSVSEIHIGYNRRYSAKTPESFDVQGWTSWANFHKITPTEKDLCRRALIGIEAHKEKITPEPRRKYLVNFLTTIAHS